MHLKIITLACCYNRRETTLRCLESLIKQASGTGHSWAHYLVDDGSTDGTAEEIELRFPSIRVIRTQGDYYWARSMSYGWNFIKNLEVYDALLMYNDDINLFQDSILKFTSHYADLLEKISDIPIVYSASFTDADGQFITYGGLRKKPNSCDPLSFSIVKPDAKLEKAVDVINMNLCLVNKKALDSFGFFASYFVHQGADFEYSLRLSRGNGYVALAPGVYGICNRDRNNIFVPLPLDSPPWVYYGQEYSIINGPIVEKVIFYFKYAGLMGLSFLVFRFVVLFMKSIARFLLSIVGKVLGAPRQIYSAREMLVYIANWFR